MSLQSVADVPLIISSPNSSSERRINPSWTIAHLKSRLEPITGVPAGSQQLSLRVASQEAVPISAVDEEQTRLSAFALQPYAEITVSCFITFSLLSMASPVPEHAILSTSHQLPHLLACVQLCTPQLPQMCFRSLSFQLACCPHSSSLSYLEAVSLNLHS